MYFNFFYLVRLKLSAKIREIVVLLFFLFFVRRYSKGIEIFKQFIFRFTG